MNAHSSTQFFDAQAFAADLDALRARVKSELGEEDLAHRDKIERWGRLCSGLGYGTAWLGPNLFSAALISQGRVTRWTMIGHHTSHRGYDRVPGVPPNKTSKRFAKGWRRMVDWLDWIDPEAWHHEHDLLHHYRLGETADPDLVEANLDWLRDSDLPQSVRYGIMALFFGTWKWTYYAPNTLQALLVEEGRKAGTPWRKRSLLQMFATRELWQRCLLPYGVVHFAAIPAGFLPLGPWAAFSVWSNSLLAEVMSNAHTFAIVVTNHAGDDLYAFDEPMADKAEFYRRQVLGSTNFPTGGDLNDFLHGWLNYQIEHHLFPDLPMRQYQRIQPEVKAICEKHGLPYVQQSVWRRLKKTLDVAVGKRSMLREAKA
ncbi:MAG: fatty acid desaturase [Proteobacteria bacterium]|nr:fatty acid desaturase [Pseudomonadota bacterium]